MRGARGILAALALSGVLGVIVAVASSSVWVGLGGAVGGSFAGWLRRFTWSGPVPSRTSLAARLAWGVGFTLTLAWLASRRDEPDLVFTGIFALLGISWCWDALSPGNLTAKLRPPRPVWVRSGDGQTTLSWIENRDVLAEARPAPWSDVRSVAVGVDEGSIYLAARLLVSIWDADAPWPDDALAQDELCIRLQESADREAAGWYGRELAKARVAVVGSAESTKRLIAEGDPRPLWSAPSRLPRTGSKEPPPPTAPLVVGDHVVGLTWRTGSLPSSHPLALVDRVPAPADGVAP